MLLNHHQLNERSIKVASFDFRGPREKKVVGIEGIACNISFFVNRKNGNVEQGSFQSDGMAEECCRCFFFASGNGNLLDQVNAEIVCWCRLDVFVTVVGIRRGGGGVRWR